MHALYLRFFVLWKMLLLQSRMGDENNWYGFSETAISIMWLVDKESFKKKLHGWTYFTHIKYGLNL